MPYDLWDAPKAATAAPQLALELSLTPTCCAGEQEVCGSHQLPQVMLCCLLAHFHMLSSTPRALLLYNRSDILARPLV